MMESGEIELTILMPCLNEAETLEVCVGKALSFLAKSGISGEVLIADNGSTDGSQMLAERAGARVVPVAQRGYGAALIGGIAAARGRYIIMGDADDSYDFEELGNFVDLLRAGNDLVMGNRFKGGIAPGAMPVLHRYLGNPVLSTIGRVFFSLPMGDFHCGLRGFRADRIRELDLQTTGMEFASEMVVRSGISGFRIAEVPTTLKPDGRSRPPHLKTWRDGWRHLKFLLMYSPKWLFIYPGAILIVIGLLSGIALAGGPVAISQHVNFDTNAFVAACFLIIVGVQLVTFGALARYYASRSGMLPRGPRSDLLMRIVTTDRAVILGALALLLGGGGLAWAIAIWAGTGFGNLMDQSVTRLMLSSVTLMIIGVQTAFAGFMFGILDIPLRKREA